MDVCIERIFSLMEEKQCTNKEFANFIGVTPSLVCDWKSGRATSCHKYIVPISKFFGVSTDYILGKTPIRTGSKWDALIEQYQLCEDDKQDLVNRLLGLTRTDADSEIYCQRSEVEEDMTMLLELVSMFDKLTIVGKSRLIAIAADELDKLKVK